MGKSTSCFKIITCASDSADKDDLNVDESKNSSDKRGWSFRKRSIRHRVLSNTVIIETPSTINKENAESATINYQAPAGTTVAEKISVKHFDEEKAQVPISVESLEEKLQTPVPVESEDSQTEVATQNEIERNVNVEESVVIVIQTAIRAFLARRLLLKLKNVIKLQAAVRGHLVRRHAVGTLRCVQAIVKIQLLVRAHRAWLFREGSCPEKLDAALNDESPTTLKENLVTKPDVKSTFIEKLLSNRFACQLLESTPNSKPICVKCNPSKSDSTWKWLERWMSVSSADSVESKKEVSFRKHQEEEHEQKVGTQLESETKYGEKEQKIESQLENGTKSEVFWEAVDSKSNIPSDNEENLITYEADNFNFQACNSTSYTGRGDMEQHQPENTNMSDGKETLVETSSLPNQTMQPGMDSQLKQKSLDENVDMVMEQTKRSTKRFASDQLKTEGKKFVSGLRNPSFIATQSKFEELHSTVNSGRSISPSYEDAGVEMQDDAISSEAITTTRTTEIDGAENPAQHGLRVCTQEIDGAENYVQHGSSEAITTTRTTEIDGAENPVQHGLRVRTQEIDGAENYVQHGLRVQIGGSECATELSISSNLDSPNRSDIGATECENILEKEIHDPVSKENLDVECEDVPAISESCLSNSASDQPVKLNIINDEFVDSLNGSSLKTEVKPETNSSDVQRVQHSEIGVQAYGSPPGASPRSRVTVVEPQGTPSSQISVKSKSKSDKGGSNQKSRSLSAGKKSPSSINHDSGFRSSVEKLPKDQKNGKRRNSFGSVKPEHGDQEPRDSTSNNSLPRFMQATESARAKLNANSSPVSSPIVQDRDVHIKKRHSLPGANGKQKSPRIQKAMFHAQQDIKSNEQKWQR